MIHKYIIPLAAAIGLVYALYYVGTRGNGSGQENAAQAVAESRIPRGTIIAGSGVIEPVGKEVRVGAPVPGIVETVIGYDRLRKPVEKGEVLFTLDDRQQRANLEVSKAVLEAAEADLEQLRNMPRKEDVPPLEAALLAAQATLDEKKDQFERAQNLVRQNPGVMPEEQLLGRKFAYLGAIASYRVADAELKRMKAGAWSSQIKVAQAAVNQAMAQVEQTKVELDLRIVKAKVPGVLLKVDVRPHEYVGGPEQTLIWLGNMDHVHVRVDIDEHDAPRFRAGLPATGFLLGDPETAYPLEFVGREPVIVPSGSLPDDPSQRTDVRVMQLIYRFKSNPDLTNVSVGQQMQVFIHDPSPDAA